MILGEEERESKERKRDRDKEEKMVIPQFIALKTYLALLPSTIAFFFFFFLKQIGFWWLCQSSNGY